MNLSTFSQLRATILIVTATALSLIVATSAQAAWQVGGQLASGSLSAAPAFQSSSEATNPVVSKDGHYEFFVSRSSLLSPSAPNGGVFRKNLWNDSAPLDVVAAQPSGLTNPNCGIPIGPGSFISTSENGRHVAFSTSENGLVSADNNGRRDVYVRDMNTAIGAGAFELVSAANGASGAPTYSLTDLAGGTDVPVPATDDCLYGAELPGQNSMSSDGRRVLFSNTAFTTISSSQGVSTAPGNLWARTTGSAQKTELVTKVAYKVDWKLGANSPNPPVKIGGPLPDQEYFDSDSFSPVRFKTLASISGDGSAVVWGGPFARYQTAYNAAENKSFAPGNFQFVNYLYRRIADGATAKTRRALSWADVDDPNCDPNLSFSYNADPDPGSPNTFAKRSACIGPVSNDQISPADVRVPAITEDGRKVFALAGMPMHFQSIFLASYPLDLIEADMSPGVSRKAGTKWITRTPFNGDATFLDHVDRFAVSGDGKRAAIITKRRDFSPTGLVQSGSFPASTQGDAIFMIDGTQGAPSGQNAWSGAPIEWVARPTGGATDTILNSFQAISYPSLDRNGRRLAFSSKDPAFFAGANGQYQAYCVTDSGASCQTTPATTVPEVSIGAPVTGASYSSSVSASYSALGATSVSCQWDAEAVQNPCPASPLAEKSLSNGSHTFSVTANNSAGATTVTATFNVGSAPAAATINTPADGASLTSPVVPTYTVSGTPDRVRCWFDSVQWTVTNAQTDFNCPAVLSNTNLLAGPHTFSVMTSNAFGSVTTTRSFVVDGASGPIPVVNISNIVDGAVYKNTISAQFTATNSPTTLQCSIDGVAYSTCVSPKSLGSLSSGNGSQHTFSVRATNAAGTATVTRTFFVVSTAPNVTINAPTSGATAVPSPVSPIFTLGGGLAATVTCQWDSEAVINDCDQSDIANKVLTSGSHTFSVTATNPMNTATATSTFDVLSPPDVTISSPTEDQDLPSPVNATFSVSGSPTSVTCQWNSEAVISPCSSPLAPKSLSEAAHTLTVSATNSSGTTTVTRNFTVAPSTSPTVTITSPSDGASGVVSPVSPTFALTGGTANSVSCQWDSETVINSCTQGLLANKTLTLGEHTLTVTASNVVGSDTKTSTFSVGQAPSVVVSAPGEGVTVGSPVTASFSLSGGAASSVTCQWDSEAVINSCASPQAGKPLAAGDHTFTVVASNAVGTSTVIRSFRVIAPPVVAITSPLDGATGVVSPVSPAFTVTGGVANTVNCEWDSNSTVIENCTEGALANWPLTSGSHSLKVTATNAAGSSVQTSTFTVIQPPIVNISTPSEGADVGTSVTANFNITGGAATSVTCQWDSEPVINSCTSPQGPKSLSTGAHAFKVTAVNGAGTSTVTRNFVVAAPVVTITSPADGASNVATPLSPQFSLSGGTATSVTCQWDSETVINSCTVAGLANKSLTAGSHSLTVTAANGVDSDTETVTFTVASPPTVSISAPVNGATGIVSPITNAAFSVGGGPTSTITCQWDSEPVISSCTSPLASKSLTGGSHSLKVTANGPGGSVSATNTFTVLAAPTVSISSPANGATSVSSPVSPAFTLGGGAAASVSCQWDSEAVISSCTAGALAGKALADGSHSLTVSATNAAGTGQATTTFSVSTPVIPPPSGGGGGVGPSSVPSITPGSPKVAASDATIPLAVTGSGNVAAKGMAKLPKGKKTTNQVAGAGSVTVTGDGNFTLKFKLNAAAKKYLKKKKKLAVNVTITYTPSGAAPITKTVKLTFKAKK
ncbi:MAG: hypothetical protein JHD02_02110 [Thermoleophilaceae bacterium]|nr:hypothetical protein [Thermoleophilaceae bacterium]